MSRQSTTGTVLAVILVAILAVAAWLVWYSDQQDQPADTNDTTQTGNAEQDEESEPATNEQPQSTTYTSDNGVTITVDKPKANDVVISPLAVSGTVPGSWSFEASFPVRLLDANRIEIAIAPATLQGDWMTDEQVPFEASLDFTAPTTDTGFLVLVKENPSGLDENADQVEIPVRFRE